jgi:hypothetical protein
MIIGERRRPGASAYLAERWGLQYSPTTLANMARKGTGPVYRLRGKYAVYEEASLDAWAQLRISGLRRKASEAAAAHAA